MRVRAVAVTAVVAALGPAACGGQERQGPDVTAAARAAGAQLISQPYAYGIGEHTNGRVRYRTNPPLNGPHAYDWAQDGNYVGQGTPRTEQLVHALEHGRIEIQYRPGLPAAQVRALERLVEESPEHVLLFENRTGMDCDVAVTAWSKGLLCKRWRGAATLEAVRAFRDAHRDKGPELVP